MTEQTPKRTHAIRRYWASPSRLRVLGGIAVVLAAALTFYQFGLRGKLVLDDAIYLYSGQQLAAGIPPYASIFDHKGPMTPFLAGAGVALARALGADEIITVRALFLVIGALAAGAVYWLGLALFDSAAASLLAAAAFVGFWGYGSSAASGPQGKTPMVLFEALALALTAQKRWFAAALLGACAALTWQPAAIFPAFTLLLAFTQSRAGADRRRAVWQAAAGAALPFALTALYFLAAGAFDAFLDGYLIFNLKFIDRSNVFLLDNLRRFRWAIQQKGFHTMAMPIFIGFASLAALLVTNLRRGWRNFLGADRSAAIFLTLPFPLLWSLIDFNGYPDFYIFLPYIAIGFGWFAEHAVRSIAAGAGSRAYPALVIALAAVMLAAAASNYRISRQPLLGAQTQWAQEISSEFGAGAVYVSINVPEALVFLRAANPNPHLFVMRGIGDYIDASTAGGFSAWLDGIAAAEPAVIFFADVNGGRDPEIEAWLREHYTERRAGEWTYYAAQP
jgi:hypothetical protein